MAVPILKAELREKVGSIYSKKVRREGSVPGVVYGHNEETRSIKVPAKETDKILDYYGDSSLVTLELGGESLQTIVQDVQRDPLSGCATHVDFHHLIKDKKVRIRIPIHITNAERLKKNNILLRQMIEQLEVACLPEDIINGLEIEASSLNMHEPLRVKDLILPGNIEVLRDPEEEVAVLFANKYLPEIPEELTEGAVEPVFDKGNVYNK